MEVVKSEEAALEAAKALWVKMQRVEARLRPAICMVTWKFCAQHEPRVAAGLRNLEMFLDG